MSGKCTWPVSKSPNMVDHNESIHIENSIYAECLLSEMQRPMIPERIL